MAAILGGFLKTTGSIAAIVGMLACLESLFRPVPEAEVSVPVGGIGLGNGMLLLALGGLLWFEAFLMHKRTHRPPAPALWTSCPMCGHSAPPRASECPNCGERRTPA